MNTLHVQPLFLEHKDSVELIHLIETFNVGSHGPGVSPSKWMKLHYSDLFCINSLVYFGWYNKTQFIWVTHKHCNFEGDKFKTQMWQIPCSLTDASAFIDAHFQAVTSDDRKDKRFLVDSLMRG